MARIGIVGGGGWGTALAHHMALQEGDIDLWVREEEVCLQIERRGVNEEFLPGVSLSPGIHPVRSLAEVSSNKEFLIIVVPSQFFRTIVTEISPLLPPSTPLLVATKGIENDTLMTMSQVVASVRGRGCDHALACLSGPSFAREVCEQHPTAVTIASSNAELAAMFQERLSTEYFRAYTTDDVIGVELGGALKNVIAIAAGVCDGLGFGDNAKSALLTRGLAEIRRLGVAMGARPQTFAGLTGLGDLITTCVSPYGRNRTVGMRLGRGETLEQILSEMQQVAEGVRTTRSARALAERQGVEMPITREVYAVLFEGKSPRQAVSDLMQRAPRPELDEPV